MSGSGNMARKNQKDIHLEDTENDMNAGVTPRDDVHSDTLSEDHKCLTQKWKNNSRQCCNQPTISLQLKKFSKI